MSDLGYYVSLLEDRRRVDAFARAIRTVVRPGDHVLEVGCGLGTYALMAVQAGAARVTAIDQNPVAIALARELGVERLGEGRLRLIEAPAELVRLEHPADVVIFEDFGSLGFRQGYRGLLEHVRTRLARPGARYVPESVDLCLSAVDHEWRTLDPAQGAPFPPEAIALLRKRALNDPMFVAVEGRHLAAPGVVVGRLRMGEAIPLRSSFSGETRAGRSTRISGLCAWTSITVGPGEILDNSPLAPQTSWRPEVLPFEVPMAVESGETLQLRYEAAHLPGPSGLLERWGIRGTRDLREGSSTNALPGDLESLRRGSLEQVPVPDPRLPAALDLLAALDGARTAAEIARMVYARHSTAFPDLGAAEELVLAIAHRLKGILVR